MYFHSQQEYEAFFSSESKSARDAAVRALTDKAISEALALFNAGAEEAAAQAMAEAGYDGNAIALWFASWRGELV